MKIFTRKYYLNSLLGKYPEPVKNSGCSEPEVDNRIISEFVIDKLLPIVGFSPFPVSELIFLTSVVCTTKPGIIFDWGTHIGKSARIFYEISKAFEYNTVIHSTDLPEDIGHAEHPHKNRGMFVRNIKSVHLHLGDGVTESIKIGRKYKKRKILFFLDGDHEFKSVKRELNKIYAAFPKSVIVVHDTFYQSKEIGYNIGPYLAVKEFLKDHKKYQYLSTSFGLPGMTALIPKKNDSN